MYDNYVLGMEKFISKFLDYLLTKKLKDSIIYKLVEFASKIDHKIKQVNKEIILYEYYLLNINKILIS